MTIIKQLKFTRNELLNMWNGKDNCYLYIDWSHYKNAYDSALTILNTDTNRKLECFLWDKSKTEYLYTGTNDEEKIIWFKVKFKI